MAATICGSLSSNKKFGHGEPSKGPYASPSKHVSVDKQYPHCGCAAHGEQFEDCDQKSSDSLASSLSLKEWQIPDVPDDAIAKVEDDCASPPKISPARKVTKNDATCIVEYVEIM